MSKQNIVFTSKEKEKIRIFKDTYNALYVREFTDDKLNKLKLHLNNPVYEKLINNLKLPHTYKVDYIEGPISLVKFKMEERGKPKKSFYIFGEEHKDTRGSCKTSYIEFDEYLYRLSQESPAFFDVYIESPMVKTKREFLTPNAGIINSVMKLMYQNERVGFKSTYDREKTKLFLGSYYMFNKLEQRFKTCSQPETRNVPECDIMRIHNIDIRITWDLNNFNPDLGLLLIEILIPDRSIPLLYKNSTPKQIMNVLRRASKGNTLILDTLNMMKTGNLMKVLKMNTRLDHERKLSYEKVNIKNFIKNKLDQFDKQFIIDKSKILIKSIEDKTAPMLSLDDLREFQDICSLLGVLKMDMYCLSRVFKTYNIKKNNPIGAFQPVESKNIIMYVGDEHAENYIDFLNYLGTLDGRNVKSTYSSRFPNDVSCVRLQHNESESKINDPFFQYRKLPPVSKEERNKMIKMLENFDIGVLKRDAFNNGFDIQPSTTKKQLIEFLFPIFIPDAIQDDTEEDRKPTVEEDRQRLGIDIKPQLLPPIDPEEERKKQRLSELSAFTYNRVRAIAKRNGINIPRYSSKKKLIQLLIESGY